MPTLTSPRTPGCVRQFPLKQIRAHGRYVLMERELWATPEAEEFLRSEHNGTEHMAFASALVRQVIGTKGKCGMTTLVRPRYLAIVIPPTGHKGADRVIVWHGPTDGIFFKDAILQRAKLVGFSVM